MKRNKVLIWSTSISDLLEGDKVIGGIAVQLYFWAQTFARHGWQVFTLTEADQKEKESICFKRYYRLGRFQVIYEWVSIFWKIMTIRPQLIISRGASREAYPLAFFSRCFGVKYILFGASDVNFEPGNELIAGGAYNRRLWQKAISKIRYVVVQNKHQQDMLTKNYGKDSIIINNLWVEVDAPPVDSRSTDVVWVANFRRLKRAEWIVNAAKAMPEYDFSLVGGPLIQENDYYNEIKQISHGLFNLHFLGKKDFAETNSIIAHSRLLCCTSTFEGFPNTFLQAWANGVPVVSTVNPSELITSHQLGVLVMTEEEFQAQVKRLLQDCTLYKELSINIRRYFTDNHSANKSYHLLMEYIK